MRSLVLVYHKIYHISNLDVTDGASSLLSSEDLKA